MYIRKTVFKLTFLCCYADGTSVNAGKPTIIDIEIQDEYATYNEMKQKTLFRWSQQLIKETKERISDTECQDWSSSLFGCKTKVSDLKYWEELPEEIYVTGVVYRIIRMRARGVVHIYGLTDKQYFDRMSEKGYTHTQARELLMLFKEGKVKTKAKV